MNDCPRFGRWIKGCNFKPRYNKSAFHGETEGDSRTSVIEAMCARTYVCDVCINCGKIVTVESVNAN